MRHVLFLSLLPLFLTPIRAARAGEPAIHESWDRNGWVATFQPYPHATELCDQHESTSGGELDWQLYAAHEETPAVVAFYVQRYGGKPHEGELEIPGPGGTHLTIYPADRLLENPECGHEPPVGTHTLIYVSRPSAAP